MQHSKSDADRTTLLGLYTHLVSEAASRGAQISIDDHRRMFRQARELSGVSEEEVQAAVRGVEKDLRFWAAPAEEVSVLQV